MNTVRCSKEPRKDKALRRKNKRKTAGEKKTAACRSGEKATKAKNQRKVTCVEQCVSHKTDRVHCMQGCACRGRQHEKMVKTRRCSDVRGAARPRCDSVCTTHAGLQRVPLHLRAHTPIVKRSNINQRATAKPARTRNVHRCSGTMRIVLWARRGSDTGREGRCRARQIARNVGRFPIDWI